MHALVLQAWKAAAVRLPTILLGETGTGKSVLAERMHAWTGRQGAFVEVNCANLGRELAESELFGHARGAFTGAHQARRGRFQEADGGTLFLDEVGELAPELQAKLLVAVEHGRFRPVGADRDLKADVFVIAATHRDLEAMVAAGTFRADLYHRLAGCVLTVPPLRARTDEIEALLASLFARHPRPDGAAWTLGEGALAVLQAHPWPGNVRELHRLARRALATLPGPVLEAEALRALLAPGQAPLSPRAWVLRRLQAGPLGRNALLKGFGRSLGVLRRALDGLVQAGAVVREGHGRGTRYALAAGVVPAPEAVDAREAARRWLARRGWTRSGLLAKALGVSPSWAKRVLAALAAEGEVEVRGRGRGTQVRWVGGPVEGGAAGPEGEASEVTRPSRPQRAGAVSDGPDETSPGGAGEGRTVGPVGGHRVAPRSWSVRTLLDLPERERRALQIAARQGQVSRRVLTRLGVPERSGSRLLRRLVGAGLLHRRGAGGWATAYALTPDGEALVAAAAPAPVVSLSPVVVPTAAPRPAEPMIASHAVTVLGLAARQGRLLLEALALKVGSDAARRVLDRLRAAGLLLEIAPGDFVLAGAARPPPDEL